jgi:hypothetical protein
VSPDLASYLRRLADRVERLAPSRHNPETFHADKSQVVAELRKLARDHDRRDPQREAERAGPTARVLSGPSAYAGGRGATCL